MKFIRYCAFLFVIFFAMQAHAQILPNSKSKEPKSLSQAEMDAVIQKNPALLQEMRKVFNDCKNNIYFGKLHDCKCYATKFLERRINLGPDVPESEITPSLGASCTNLPAIAGDFYERCVEFNTGLLNDVKSYCTCFGNQVAKNYQKTPGSTAIHLMMLRDQATTDCQYTERRINTLRSRN